jgi:hypothetical protein
MSCLNIYPEVSLIYEYAFALPGQPILGCRHRQFEIEQVQQAIDIEVGGH